MYISHESIVFELGLNKEVNGDLTVFYILHVFLAVNI